MLLLVRPSALVLLLLAAGCAERPAAAAAPLQWRDGGRPVRVELALDRLRVLGVGDAAAVRRIVPSATVAIAADAAVVTFPAVDAPTLAGHARRLAALGEVQGAVRGDLEGWLGHHLSATLPAGADAAAIAVRHRLTLVDRPAYAPDRAVFASDPADLGGAVAAAAALVAAGDADEATPLVHRQARPRAR